MKRGNTALKRGVGLASAFALAIAGAVIAAPAANAAFTGSPLPTNDLLRVKPAADATWLGANGEALSTNAGVVTYGANHANGQVPVIKSDNLQGAADVQVLLPIKTADSKPAWISGEKITLNLDSSKVAWQKLAVTATLQAKPVKVSDLGTFAGWSGAGGKAGVAAVNTTDSSWLNTTGNDINLTTKVTFLGDQTMQIELPDPGTATAASGQAYLLTVSNLRVNVADDFVASSAQSAPVVVTLKDSAASLGTTTIAYATKFSIGTAGDSSFTNGTVSLPTIKVSEDKVAAFATAANTLVLKVTSDKAGDNPIVHSTSGTTAKLNNVTVTAPTITGSDNVITATTGATSATKFETLNLSGVTVSGVSAGAKLTITLTDQSRAAVQFADDTATATASTFSVVPNQRDTGVSVVVSPEDLLPRTAGDNRYDTAAQLAAQIVDGNTDAIVIANGEDAKLGIDALSANFLAGVEGAPILLTQANTLPKPTKDALTDLFEDSGNNITVYVMGKTDSVSQAVRDEIVATLKATINKANTVTVKQIAGSDRYATSVASASEAPLDIQQYDLGKGNLRTAFLASGLVNADALAAGSVSAGAGIPVLLTSAGAELPKSVSDAISSLVIQQVVILGGTDRVSAAVATALETAGINVVRVAGTDRFDTAVQIATLARKAIGSGFYWGGATGAVLANGVGGFADALAVGPVAGSNESVVLTVSDGASLPASTSNYLKAEKGNIKVIDAVGGKDRVQDSVITEALKAIGAI